MPHTTIDETGAVVYRTKLMEIARAGAYARMIGANAGRFEGVKIVASAGKTARYFVQFRPVSVQRQGDIYGAEHQKNAARAEAEGGDYIYWKDPDIARRTWVFNPASGETYDMWSGICQCPQKQFRLTQAALLCKHEIEMDNRIAAGIDPFGGDKQTPNVTQPAADVETPEQRGARIKRDIERDFC